MYALCIRATTGQVTPALPSPGHMPQPPGKPHTPQWRRNGRFQRPTVTSSGQRSLPTANGHFQWPTVTSSGHFQQSTAASDGQCPLPTATSNGQRPLPTVNGHFQRAMPTSNGQRPLPTAASNGHFQRPSASRTPGQAVRAVAAAVAVWLCRSCVAVSCRLSRHWGPEPQRPLAGSRRLCPGGRQKVKGFQ